MEYADTIAPKTADLPQIMTMADAEERQTLVAKFNEMHRDGKWNGHINASNGRPSIGMATKRSREEQANGDRAGYKVVRYRPDGKTKCGFKSPTVRFMAYHVALVAAGLYPTEERNVASHICHKKDCCIVGHVVWSSHSENVRRERLCHKKRACACGLEPKCNFALH